MKWIVVLGFRCVWGGEDCSCCCLFFFWAKTDHSLYIYIIIMVFGTLYSYIITLLLLLLLLSTYIWSTCFWFVVDAMFLLCVEPTYIVILCRSRSCSDFAQHVHTSCDFLVCICEICITLSLVVSSRICATVKTYKVKMKKSFHLLHQKMHSSCVFLFFFILLLHRSILDSLQPSVLFCLFLYFKSYFNTSQHFSP